MLPARGDGFLTTAEAAQMIGVAEVTIRQWRKRGRLPTQGRDERGYPLHSAEAVRAAEGLVRRNGIDASGIDPRQLRRGYSDGEAALWRGSAPGAGSPLTLASDQVTISALTTTRQTTATTTRPDGQFCSLLRAYLSRRALRTRSRRSGFSAA